MRNLRVLAVLIVVSLPAVADSFSFTATGYLGSGSNVDTGTFSIVSPSVLTVNVVQPSLYGNTVALFDNSTRAYISDWTNLQPGTYLYGISAGLLLQPNGDPFTGGVGLDGNYAGYSCVVSECGAYIVNSDFEIDFILQDAPTEVPEPSTVVFFATGLAGAVSWRRR